MIHFYCLIFEFKLNNTKTENYSSQNLQTECNETKITELIVSISFYLLVYAVALADCGIQNEVERFLYRKKKFDLLKWMKFALHTKPFGINSSVFFCTFNVLFIFFIEFTNLSSTYIFKYGKSYRHLDEMQSFFYARAKTKKKKTTI